ncbi:MAG: DNA replication/repair protein RecF [Holosporales bacterium]|jgi:DNA replication and repair protein RecF|nr:DNA replication/repair protein RecF [Holosporales bacterium]
MITNIHLHNFRNYTDIDLPFTKSLVVLFGPNGAGKTNLLEAISMLAIGRGLRNATLPEITNTASGAKETTWAVQMVLNNEIALSTGSALTENNRFRRVCKIQGEFVKSAAKFHEYLNIISITPLMDHIFIDAPSIRRKFIDDLITSYSPEHSINLQQYEKAQKQRFSVLKSGPYDDKWLLLLEEIMAERSILISAARNDFVERLNEGQAPYIPLFPRFYSKIVGKAENLTKDEIFTMLGQNRERDKLAGITTFGCHRSDWEVSHLCKNRVARECSTGEQKILLVSVILSFVNQQLKKNDTLIILLLDDVIARLDASHRAVLFDQASEFRRGASSGLVQVFFTGTDAELFGPVADAQFLRIDRASVVI